MFSSIPLLIISLVLYNIVAVFGGAGGAPLEAEMFSMNMMSGGRFTLNTGDLLIVVSLVLLFVEIIKSTRSSNASVVDHLLSTGVFILFLVEFLLVPAAATSVFFILMLMSLLDLLAGFSVSIRSAGRDVSVH
jgi:steroid 5-alpha reductase family enzyme